MRRIYLFVALLISGLAACQQAKPEAGPETGVPQLPLPDLSARPIRVLATTGMIADMMEQIGKEHVKVDCLMGQQDPHSFVPVARDRERLEKADLIVYNGLHLEGKMGELFEEMRRRVRTVAVANGIDHKDLRKVDNNADGEHDPHIWFNVRLWMKAVIPARDALIEIDPAHRETFETNAKKYLEELTKLDTEIRDKIGKFDKDKRVLITAHDAFGYFGDEYGFTVHGLQGVSTASDISSRDVSALAEIIGQQKIRTIFAETSVPDRSLQAVQESVRKKYRFEVELAQTKLFSDALGDPGTPEGTYIGMVRHNVDTILAALK